MEEAPIVSWPSLQKKLHLCGVERRGCSRLLSSAASLTPSPAPQSKRYQYQPWESVGYSQQRRRLRCRSERRGSDPLGGSAALATLLTPSPVPPWKRPQHQESPGIVMASQCELRIYGCEILLDFDRATSSKPNLVVEEELRGCGFLWGLAPSLIPSSAPQPWPEWKRDKRCERKQKLGKRGGI